MLVINARNVHAALPEALHQLRVRGQTVDTRNGPATRFPEPLATVYEKPTERVLFHPLRDANPFFHLAEALWMLDGRDDVDPVAWFAANMRNYSDDGDYFWGAYGYRWRRWFGYDQLKTIADLLRADPNTRRAYLGMWDPSKDPQQAEAGGKDVPCNVGAVFEQVGPRLNMTVFNRSNDLVWGAYGSNAVHFSLLQEWMAYQIGAVVGTYTQVSANAHVYESYTTKLAPMMDGLPDGYGPGDTNPYLQEVAPFPLKSSATTWQEWQSDLKDAVATMMRPSVMTVYNDPFFNVIVRPMMLAWSVWKGTRDAGAARIALEAMPLRNDWRKAADEWLLRRKRL